MTVKQLTEIVNGRLKPSTAALDADILEVSEEQGNALQVKEDGLFYKEKGVSDGLAIKDGTIGIDEYGISLNKLQKTSSTEQVNPVAAETLQSLEEHLSNLYGLVKQLKGETTASSNDILQSIQGLNTSFTGLQERLTTDYYLKGETSTAINTAITNYDINNAMQKFRLKTEVLPETLLYGSRGVLVKSPKIFTAVVVANSNGDWSVDYSHVGFTQVPIVTATGQSVGTASADRRFASLGPNQPTKTGCSGKLATASSAGLLAAMLLLSGSGNVSITAIGY